jgi:hypothetical protein
MVGNNFRRVWLISSAEAVLALQNHALDCFAEFIPGKAKRLAMTIKSLCGSVFILFLVFVLVFSFML